MNVQSIYQERKFYLNKALYSIHFKNTSLVKEMDFLYQFGIIIPFHLPFPPKGFISFCQDSSVISTAFFDNNIENIMFDGTYRDDASLIIESNLSRIEFAFFSNQNFDDFTVIFDKCIEHLNNLITSYKIKYQDNTVYRVTTEMISTPTTLIRKISDLTNWEYEDYLFIINSNIPFKKDTLSMNEFLGLTSFVRVIEKNENPFSFVEEMKLESIRKMNLGEYREAILFESICIETFLINMYKEMQKEKGTTDINIKKSLNFPVYKGLKTLFINSYLPNLLGGKWNYNDRSSEIGEWHQNSYKMRNKVVHGGYTPDYTEANQSITANTEFRDWIMHLLKQKRIEYPYTNSLYNQ